MPFRCVEIPKGVEYTSLKPYVNNEMVSRLSKPDENDILVHELDPGRDESIVWPILAPGEVMDCFEGQAAAVMDYLSRLQEEGLTRIVVKTVPLIVRREPPLKDEVYLDRVKKLYVAYPESMSDDPEVSSGRWRTLCEKMDREKTAGLLAA